MRRPFRLHLCGLVAVLCAPAWGLELPDPVVTPLPDNQAPWWPSLYGQQDQIGSLNRITPAVTAAAAKLVRSGETVDLGRTLDEKSPAFPGRWWHQSLNVAPHFINRHDDPDGLGRNQVNWITEIQSGTFQVGTQLDTIGHLQIGDRFYNGWTTRQLVTESGLARFGTETIPPIVTRGILLDIAALKGVDRLDKGYVITVADIEAALKRERLEIRAGDAVLFHTGWGALWGKDDKTFLSGEPGVGLAAATWLNDHKIAITGADTWSYGAVPGEDPDRPFIVPQTMYVRWGLFGLENLATEAIARRGVHEFLFVVTHAKTRGSTAAIVAPAAVF